MERESFVFYRSFYDAILDLDAEQTRMLLIAVCERALNWADVEINDKVARMAMNLIRPQLDANTKRFMDGQKWWQYWHLWWAPKGNSNAGKTWENISKQPQWGNKNNPSGVTKTTPNVNVNVNDNVNDNEKGCGEKREAGNTLDADASRWNIDNETVAKKNGVMLEDRLLSLWLEREIIELAITYNECKKWKKLSKFKDPQLKIWVDKLRRCWFNTIEWMKQVLENSIAGWYEWIFELKQKPIVSSQVSKDWKVIQRWWYNFYL